jgi:N-acetylmuramoyl-L-alanine amidase
MEKKSRTIRELSRRVFAFGEKFTTLSKVMANSLNMARLIRNIGFTGLFLAITLLNSSNAPIQNDFKVKTIVIDAGHGGKHPGTSGKYTTEKNITLKVALKLGKLIEENLPGVKVLYTRKTDVFIGLAERAKVATDNHADVFISIHANSLPTETPDARKQSIYGTETYVMGLHKNEENFEVAKRENSVILLEDNYKEKYAGFDPNSPESYILFSLTQSASQEGSLQLASKIENEFGKRAGRHSRGVKQAGFQVLWMTTMPSVLVEIGYLSNTKEERDLNDDKVQDYIASGVYRAFRDYKNEVESIKLGTK